MGFLTFAFKGTVSEEIIKLLPLHHKVILESSLPSIDSFVQDLLTVQPEFILGLGEYTGRGDEKIRIETVTWNKFRNNRIGSGPEFLTIHPFVKLSEGFKLTHALGNSWCNLISYKIVEQIENKKLKSKYTFLHIPKNYSLETVSESLSPLFQ